MSKIVLAAAILGCALALVACSKSSAPSTASTTTVQNYASADEAALHLYNAWKADDRASALQGAPTDAVTEIFKDRYIPPGYTFAGRDHFEADRARCDFKDGPDQAGVGHGPYIAIFVNSHGPAASWHVESVDYGD